MSAFFSALLLAACYLVQTTLIPMAMPGAAWPDLLIACVGCIALLRGALWGGITGFACGMFLDAQFSASFGLHTLLLTFFGLLCGALLPNASERARQSAAWAERMDRLWGRPQRSDRWRSDRFFRPTLAAMLCCGVKQFVLFTVAYFQGNPVILRAMPLSVGLSILYTGAATLVLYQLFYLCNRGAIAKDSIFTAR